MPQLHLIANNTTTVMASVAQALAAQPGADKLLFMSPHDDDAAIGLGMTIAQAAAEGFEVHIGVVTDGRQGYCTLEEKNSIVATRQRETRASYQVLGIPEDRIHFLGFPDCALEQATGRRPAQPGDPAIAGFTGLENSLTHLLRTVAPRAIFITASTDLHPDHRAVHHEVLISIYHAAGTIWPELGAPSTLPEVFEYPTYVTMAAPPNIMLEADTALFQRKLDSIGCYVSQTQIGLVTTAIREAGPVEFIRNIRFAIYHPSVYRPLFKHD